MKISTAQILLCCVCLLFALTFAANGQSPPGKEEPKGEFALKVAVEEVRIDAIVLDGKGRQITDLTSDDFELSQDGRKQKIISCAYVPYRDRSVAKSSAAQSGSASSRDEVQRSIVFVIDDLNMRFEDHYYARMSLQRFVESQMQIDDMVAIIQSGQGIGALQRFSSDKQKLLSEIKDLPWSGSSYTGGQFEDISASFDNMFPYTGTLSMKGVESSGTVSGGYQMDLYMARQFTVAEKDAFEAQTAPLEYSIRALQDMPGRKTLIYITPVISALGPDDGSAYDELSDKSLRAGVVIYTLDVKGSTITRRNDPRLNYLPLSKKTGGILLENNSFFLHGIGPVEEALRGYYLLSYIPPRLTFLKDSQNYYHRVQVKVKRRGAEVHSRDGFFGTINPSNPVPGTTTLKQAILSPFLYDNLELSVSSGYAYAQKPGYFLRSWLHLDGKNLTFTDEKDGGHSLALELITLTADAKNVIRDSKGLQYKFTLSDSDVSRIRREGIDLKAYLIVKKPGKYYVRAAIRDMATGKIGSGYQYLNVQDIKGRRISLSSIFLLNPGENLNSIVTGNIVADSDSEDIARRWEASRKSPARRSYRPGESFDYMAIAYISSISKGSPGPNLEFQFSISKDGKELYKGNVEAIDLQRVDNAGWIPISKRLDLNTQMEGGVYQLQLRIDEKQSKGKDISAFQTLDFKIQK